MIRFLIGLEVLGLLFVGYLALGALRWDGPENWAAVGLAIYGGPVLLVQLFLMAIGLVLIHLRKSEPEENVRPRMGIILPACLSLCLFIWAIASEMYL